jgi:membrane fusion protein (multidrug efflux system)
VTTGRRDEAEGRVEVLQGLEPDATVLALRFDALREGRKAVVVSSRAAPLASAAASGAARP